jgi:hypothetical protein
MSFSPATLSRFVFHETFSFLKSFSFCLSSEKTARRHDPAGVAFFSLLLSSALFTTSFHFLLDTFR